MNVAREVILDLLPLYTAGELSLPSRQLVEAALAEDAALRRLAGALQKEPGATTSDLAGGLDLLDRELDALLGGVDAQLADLSAEAEKRSFSEARLRSGLRNLLLGAAIFATLSIFAFWFDGRSITMLKDAFPQLIPPLVLAAAVLWCLVLVAGWLADVVLSLLGRK